MHMEKTIYQLKVEPVKSLMRDYENIVKLKWKYITLETKTDY